MDDTNDQTEILLRIRENQGIIYKICNTYCSNKIDREDLAQEILYRLIKSYPTYKQEYKFSTWMYRVALNIAISFYRKSATRNTVELSAFHENVEDDSEEAGRLENNISILQKFISELKELEKALMLLYLESKSHKEISDILGISESNVSTKINRIKNKLQQKFSKINQ